MMLSGADPLHILFVLPVAGGGGGAHSIAQEAAGMRRIGIAARVAVWAHQLADFHRLYADLPECAALFVPFRDPAELSGLCASSTVVVATLTASVALLAPMLATMPQVLSACYAQDYEPWFHPEGPARQDAAATYTLVPGMVFFAKTDWLCGLIGNLHGVIVHKVTASVDHRLFHPGPVVQGQVQTGPAQPSPVRISAMVRPDTARRRAQATMEVLRDLSRTQGARIAVTVFGTDDPGLATLPCDFPHGTAGILTRPQVASLLRTTDIFIDLSAYQAFGRSAIEAMACGAVALVPKLGGAGDYAVDGVNAMVVDTADPTECLRRLDQIIHDPVLLARLRQAAVITAARYTVEAAVDSEVSVFRAALARGRYSTAASAAAPPASGTT